MVPSRGSPIRTFLRDALVSTLVLAGLYGAAQGIQFQPLQIPGYLLIVGFDVLEGLIGPAGSAAPVLFGLYLLALGTIGAAIAAVARARSRTTTASSWRVGVAGALGVVGAISLLFGVAILVGTTQLTPILVTGAVGLCLLVLAGWLGGLDGQTITRKV